MTDSPALDYSTPVVTLYAGLGSLGIMRTLGKLGVDVYMVCDNAHSAVLRSRYCRRTYLHSLAEKDHDDLLKLLQTISESLDQKPILIATSDELAILVAEQHELLNKFFLIAQNTDGLTRQLADKMAMFRLAKEHGLPTPLTLLPRSFEEAQSMLSQLAFPVMLKAVFGNRMKARSGKKMARADNEQELLDTYRELEDPEFPNIMLQELIPGDDDQVWIFNGFFDQNSDCTVPFTGRKIRQFPIHVGCASLGECTWHERVAQQTMTFMKAIGYKGILDIGYRYDARDDQYKVLDINPRVGQAFRLFVAEGDVDVVKCLYLSATGQSVPNGAAPQEGRRWLIEDFDLDSSFHYFQEGTLTLRQWLSSLFTVDEFAWFDWRDLKPAITIYWRLFTRAIHYVGKSVAARLGRLTTGRTLLTLRRKLKILWRTVAPRKPDQVYFSDRVEQYRSMWQNVAEDVGGNFQMLDYDIWRISKGTAATHIHQYRLSLDNPVALELAARKAAVHRILQQDGLPVPDHALVSLGDINSANSFLLRFPNGVVIKPNTGYGGKGVTTHVTTERQLTSAMLTASVYDHEILIEEQVYGECYRVLVFRGVMMSAVRRSGLRVTGDGQTALSSLLAKSSSGNKDADLTFCLAHTGLTMESVVPKDESVLIKCVGNTFRAGSELRTIYDEDVTADLCAAVADTACRAAALIESEFAGIDIITTDISEPLETSGGIVNEINTTPALHHHYDANSEPFPAAARVIVQNLLGVHA